MARLGIDFGTTNTVAVCSDRGRYPLVPHVVDTAIGQVVRDIFPSVLAYEHATGRLLYGTDAERCLVLPGAHRRFGALRSIKRLLRDYVGGGRIGHDLRTDGFDTLEVLRGFAEALRASILRSGLFAANEPLEAVVTWPANANGAQRYATRACFKAAGFDVIGTLNEPTAAAIEFADRMVHGNRTAARRFKGAVVIFDFGGGTFDASLVSIAGNEFSVIDTAGIDRLGGDDLDEVLARLFAQALAVDYDCLPRLQHDLLLRHACQQKEAITSGPSRSLTLVPGDLGLTGGVCTVPVAAYFDAIAGLIAPAVDTIATLISGAAARAAGIAADDIHAVYLVGGSSKLPLVPQMIAARFPQLRLVMTDKPFTATAMGAAMHSTETVTLRDILSRHFGVIRLADHGQREVFAPIFPAGTHLPTRGAPSLHRTVEYSPHHNIGHLRYLECAAVDAAGHPCTGVRPWSDVLFPYDPGIPVGHRIAASDVRDRHDLGGATVRETYTCDSDGVISVRVTRHSDGQSRVYEIFRA